MNKFKSKRKERLENRKRNFEFKISELEKVTEGIIATLRTLDDPKLQRELEEHLAKYNIRAAATEIRLIKTNRVLSREFN